MGRRKKEVEHGDLAEERSIRLPKLQKRVSVSVPEVEINHSVIDGAIPRVDLAYISEVESYTIDDDNVLTVTFLDGEQMKTNLSQYIDAAKSYIMVHKKANRFEISIIFIPAKKDRNIEL